MKPGLWLALAVAGVGGMTGSQTMLSPPTPTAAGLIRVEGAISPATVGYITRGIREAAAQGRSCLIIQLDTPGGLLDSTREIVRAFYGSPVATVVYVAPPGASATSAGCFLTLAADVAAMAPNTTIGAAHPVALGGMGETPPDPVLTQKVENYAVSYLESIAARRHRNVDWARSAVRESASVTAERALELKVIDLIARDVPDLLRQLDGREIGGRPLRLDRREIVVIPMQVRERVFQLLWRPEVIFVLLLIALYGIIGELSNPGVILPGVAGAIALVLLLYMGAILPLDIAGLAMIGLAVGLFIADVFAPTHGVLTAGGVTAFFLGALMLFDKAGPAFRLSLGMIVPATLLTAAFFVFVVGAGLRAQTLPVRMGPESLRSQLAVAGTAIDAQGGKVLLDGEIWHGVSDTPIEAGRAVEVLGTEGLTLKVGPKYKERRQG